MHAVYLADPDAWNARRRQRRVDDPEAARRLDREAYARFAVQKRESAHGYRRRNPEKVRIAMAAWVAANPDKVRENSRKASIRRKLRLLALDSPGVTRDQWRAICETHGFRCVYCGVEDKLTVDHVIPISRGGLDSPENVVPACRSCNCSKGAKLLSEWQRKSAA
jgi:5-methylcytosine-specific restriction endonuclease McrA